MNLFYFYFIHNCNNTGDPFVLIYLAGVAEYAYLKGKLKEFCIENGLRENAVIEVRKLRKQLSDEILLNFPYLDIHIDPR